MRYLISALASILLAQAAQACLWDREVVPAEKEFKSRYIEKEPPPAVSPESEPSTPLNLLAYGGGGIALLVGAFVVGMSRSKSG